MYSLLLNKYAAGKEAAKAYADALTSGDATRLEEYIRTQKGVSGGLPLSYHLDPKLPQSETDAANWFMRQYSSYQPE